MLDNLLLAGYIGEIELAKQLGVGLRTLREWRTKGVGPPITYIGRRPHFKISSVTAWLDSRERKMPRAHLPRDRRRTSPAD
jgi:hypothetical protein